MTPRPAIAVPLLLALTALLLPGGAPPAGAATPGAAPLLVLGDSLCVGAERWGGLRERLQAEGWEPELVCEVGEALGWGIERVLERERVPATVVVALGTNPGPFETGFGAKVATMRSELRSRGAREVVWMTFAERDGDRYGAKNEVVRDLAEASPLDDLRLADWAPVVEPNPAWFSTDGLHYTTEGKRQWASFLTEVVSATRPVAPFASVRDFVHQQYLDLLNRVPEQGGVEYWEAALTADRISRDAFVEQLVRSPEFAGRLAPVARLYHAVFGRLPDREGLRYWAASGAPLLDMAQHFASSAEFRARYGDLDDAGFVRQLYRNVLGREADAAGAGHWEAVLAGGAARGQVVLGFSESGELQRRSGPTVQALMLYVGLLGRDPDPEGLRYWEGVLAGGVPLRGVVGGFLDSAEYRLRVGELGHRTTRG